MCIWGESEISQLPLKGVSEELTIPVLHPLHHFEVSGKHLLKDTGAHGLLPWWGQWQRICLLSQETQETWVRSLDGKDPLEKRIAIRSSILAWRIPWTEEPSGPQSMELKNSQND